jgi:hypothetical protein
MELAHLLFIARLGKELYALGLFALEALNEL